MFGKGTGERPRLNQPENTGQDAGPSGLRGLLKRGNFPTKSQEGIPPHIATPNSSTTGVSDRIRTSAQQGNGSTGRIAEQRPSDRGGQKKKDAPVTPGEQRDEAPAEGQPPEQVKSGQQTGEQGTRETEAVAAGVMAEEAGTMAKQDDDSSNNNNDSPQNTDQQSNDSHPRLAEDSWQSEEIKYKDGTSAIHEDKYTAYENGHLDEYFTTVKASDGSILDTESETSRSYLNGEGETVRQREVSTNLRDGVKIDQSFTSTTSQDSRTSSLEYTSIGKETNGSEWTNTHQLTKNADGSWEYINRYQQFIPERLSPHSGKEETISCQKNQSGEWEITRSTSFQDRQSGKWEISETSSDNSIRQDVPPTPADYKLDVPRDEMLQSHLELPDAVSTEQPNAEPTSTGEPIATTESASPINGESGEHSQQKNAAREELSAEQKNNEVEPIEEAEQQEEVTAAEITEEGVAEVTEEMEVKQEEVTNEEEVEEVAAETVVKEAATEEIPEEVEAIEEVEPQEVAKQEEVAEATEEEVAAETAVEEAATEEIPEEVEVVEAAEQGEGARKEETTSSSVVAEQNQSQEIDETEGQGNGGSKSGDTRDNAAEGGGEPKGEGNKKDGGEPRHENEAKPPNLGVPETFDRDKFITEKEKEGLKASTDKATGVTTIEGNIPNTDGTTTTHTIEISQGADSTQNLKHNSKTTTAAGDVIREEHTNAKYDKDGKLLSSNREVIDTSTPDQRITTRISRDEDGTIRQQQRIDNKVPGTNEWKNGEWTTITFDKDGKAQSTNDALFQSLQKKLQEKEQKINKLESTVDELVEEQQNLIKREKERDKIIQDLQKQLEKYSDMAKKEAGVLNGGSSQPFVARDGNREVIIPQGGSSYVNGSVWSVLGQAKNNSPTYNINFGSRGEGGRRMLPLVMIGLFNNVGNMGRNVANGAKDVAGSAAHP
jgi:hypothetical protein